MECNSFQLPVDEFDAIRSIGPARRLAWNRFPRHCTTLPVIMETDVRSGVASGNRRSRRRLDHPWHANRRNAQGMSDDVTTESPLACQSAPRTRHVGCRGPTIIL